MLHRRPSCRSFARRRKRPRITPATTAGHLGAPAAPRLEAASSGEPHMAPHPQPPDQERQGRCGGRGRRRLLGAGAAAAGRRCRRRALQRQPRPLCRGSAPAAARPRRRPGPRRQPGPAALRAQGAAAPRGDQDHHRAHGLRRGSALPGVPAPARHARARRLLPRAPGARADRLGRVHRHLGAAAGAAPPGRQPHQPALPGDVAGPPAAAAAVQPH
jgi:hypothetical protein